MRSSGRWRALERGERLARAVAVNLDGRIDLSPRKWFVSPASEAKDVSSLSGGVAGSDGTGSGRGQDRFNLVGIVPAAADDAGDRHAHLLRSRVRILEQERGAAHDHGRRAKAALTARVIDEGLLDRMQAAVFLQPLDRGELLSDGFLRELQTG